MARPRKASAKKASNGANLGFEATLWAAADKLRNNMDAAEYKHVVLGLIFLKYISDAFEERHRFLEAAAADPNSEQYVKESSARYGVSEDRDEYASENVFWVPKEARWVFLQANAKQPTIGKIVDDSMSAIERENPSLRGVLPKIYGREDLNKERLGELIDLVGTIALGEKADRSKDTLGRVYEYFLSQFAGSEGKKGGQFYTPRSVVRLLVEMTEPYEGRVYDPCCGSGGMFVQSERFVEAHGGRTGDISIFGQESNATTWRLARMNLALRGIEANLGAPGASSFTNDLHPDLRADFILANPPFNDDDWGYSKLTSDVRWKFGMPPKGGPRKMPDGSVRSVDGGNANFAWVQHFIHHLAPSGIAGFVLANGSMAPHLSQEKAIIRNVIDADLVDCMIALPGQLFFSTPIPACLWFLRRNKLNGQSRNRRGQTLFIDARKLGHLVDRTHRDLSDEDVSKIAGVYHAWRSRAEGSAKMGEGYSDILGFCKSATLEDIRKHGHVLAPGRYVGAQAQKDDGEPFDEKMKRLTATLREQKAEAVKLDAAITANLKELGFGG